MTHASTPHNSTDWRHRLRSGKPTPQFGRPVTVSSPSPNSPWWERPWVAASGVLAGLLLWNWVLMVTLAIALAVSVGVYLHLTHQLRLPRGMNRSAWRRNRNLWLSLLAGGGTLALFALGITIWQESESSGLAIALLLQGMGTWVAVGAIARWMRHSSVNSDSASLSTHHTHQLLLDLTDSQPLKRLRAVRVLTRNMLQSSPSQLSSTQQHSTAAEHVTVAELRQYFHLMLEQESHAQVRSALQESLNQLKSSAESPREASCKTSQPYLTAAQRPTIAVETSSLKESQPLLMRRRVRSRSSKVACPEVLSSHS